MTTPHHNQHRRPPLALIACAVIVVCVVALAVVLIVWREWSNFAVAAPWLAQTLRFAGFLVPVVTAYAIIVGLWRRYADHRYIQAHHVELLTLAQRSQGLPAGVTSLNVHPGSAAPEQAPGAP